MLRIDVVTIFPGMVTAPVSEGIVKRAADAGLVRIAVHDLRDYTDDRHRSVDDAPFGGGPGMVMKAEPFFRAREAVLPRGPGPRDAVVLVDPGHSAPAQSGRPRAAPVTWLEDEPERVAIEADRYARLERLLLLCGRYEGIDERVGEGVATEEVSLGDFVLTGGEVAALAVIEATVRLIPGALGDEGSAAADSFGDGILDCPHYTRPAVVRGLAVPETLLSGDHGRIRRWRRKEALRATRQRRPDLLRAAPLTAEDRTLLREIEEEQTTAGVASAALARNSRS